MHTLVAAILTALQNDASLDYVRDSDIYAASNLNLVRPGVKGHFIAVKDGRVTIKELSCAVIEKTAVVQLAVYVHLAKDQAGLLGDSSSSKTGVLEFAGDVAAVLKGNLLSISGMQAALPSGEEESELFLNEDGTAYQRKRINFTYIWEE